ncbi:hypothetical protein FQA39_LY16859 [Lamprigera yunnana]|nr:hypothetical protein FQA39_LY16859 [Lamprigera yunnana]
MRSFLTCVFMILVSVSAITIPGEGVDKKTLTSLGIKTLDWQQENIELHHNYSKVTHSQNVSNRQQEYADEDYFELQRNVAKPTYIRPEYEMRHDLQQIIDAEQHNLEDFDQTYESSNIVVDQKPPEVFYQCPRGETGSFPYALSCNKFLNCWKGRGFLQNCAPGTLFNPSTYECDYVSKVTCVSATRSEAYTTESLTSQRLKTGCPAGFSGIVPHHYDCSKFINCDKGKEVVMDCAPGTLFNLKINSCDYPYNTECASWSSQFGTTDDHENIQQSSSNVGANKSDQNRNKKPQCPNGESGLFPHPWDCSKFLNCANGQAFVQDCGPGTVYNPNIKVCDYPNNVDCSVDDSEDYTGRIDVRIQPHEPSSSLKCPPQAKGIHPHPTICSKYVKCNYGIAQVEECPQGLVYDPISNGCDYTYNVDCSRKHINMIWGSDNTQKHDQIGSQSQTVNAWQPGSAGHQQGGIGWNQHNNRESGVFNQGTKWNGSDNTHNQWFQGHGQNGSQSQNVNTWQPGSAGQQQGGGEFNQGTKWNQQNQHQGGTVPNQNRYWNQQGETGRVTNNNQYASQDHQTNISNNKNQQGQHQQKWDGTQWNQGLVKTNTQQGQSLNSGTYWNQQGQQQSGDGWNQNTNQAHQQEGTQWNQGLSQSNNQQGQTLDSGTTQRTYWNQQGQQQTDDGWKQNTNQQEQTQWNQGLSQTNNQQGQTLGSGTTQGTYWNQQGQQHTGDGWNQNANQAHQQEETQWNQGLSQSNNQQGETLDSGTTQRTYWNQQGQQQTDDGWKQNTNQQEQTQWNQGLSQTNNQQGQTLGSGTTQGTYWNQQGQQHTGDGWNQNANQAHQQEETQWNQGLSQSNNQQGETLDSGTTQRTYWNQQGQQQTDDGWKQNTNQQEQTQWNQGLSQTNNQQGQTLGSGTTQGTYWNQQGQQHTGDGWNQNANQAHQQEETQWNQGLSQSNNQQGQTLDSGTTQKTYWNQQGGDGWDQSGNFGQGNHWNQPKWNQDQHQTNNQQNTNLHSGNNGNTFWNQHSQNKIEQRSESQIKHQKKGDSSKLKPVCTIKDFHCSRTACVPMSMYCDGVNDCPNGEDERHCDKILNTFTLIPNHILVVREKEKYFNVTVVNCAISCLESKGFQCRSFSYRKDDGFCFLTDSNLGTSGSLIISYPYDYYELSALSINCENLYKCPNQKCIANKQVCDGVNDCGDRADEKGCSADKLGYEISLVGGENKDEGRIQIKAFGKIGYVCDDKFGLRNADVVCKELGSPLGAAEVKGSSYYAQDVKDTSVLYLMDDVTCLGNESSLRDCDFNGWGVSNCEPQEIVGVVCKTPQETCPKDHWRCDTVQECLPLAFVCDGVYDCTDQSDEASQHCDAPIEVRLVGGKTKHEGRVEIRHYGIWGTVCDDDFNDDAAKVVCKYLGYPGKAVAQKDGMFGAGTGPIWLDQVFCQGNESGLQHCVHWNWGEHNCEHSEDVGVTCSDTQTPVVPSERRAQGDDLPESVYIEQCGLRDDAMFLANNEVHFRVVGGAIANRGDYPWQASIRVKNQGQMTHWCGAVVITKKFVLTAAHCLQGFSKGAYTVVVGDYNTDDDEGTEQDAFIEEFYIHERFRIGQKMNNDIALIKLKGRGFTFTKNVQPICLPESDIEYEDGQNCTISGFGSIQSGKSSYSHDMRAAYIPLIDQEVCKMPHVYGNTITDGMVCAGSLDEGADACEGDSGGPLACLHNGYYTLYGITSWGHHCGHANKPGVYVRVAYYRKWIDDTILKHV